MIDWLKKHFVPHTENNHRPLLLQAQNARAILALVLVVELLLFVLPTLTFVNRVTNTNLASVLPGVLAVLTNDEREQNNLPDLTVSPLLTQAAELKAKDMAEKGYFAHTSPEGKTPWYWLDLVGYEYDYAGENLAINFSDSKDVTNAWMNSPTHRANIVKSSYHEVGTGVATGMYQGRETVFVAQVYANPRNAVVEKAQLAQAVPTQTTPKPETKPVTVPKPKTETPSVEETPAPVTETQIAQNAEESVVLGETSEKTIQAPRTPRVPTDLEKITSSPRHAVSVTLGIILGIVMLALLLNILIKSNIQHPDLITNGLFVAAVIVAILATNNFIGTKDIVISQGFDYSHTQTASVINAL